jgi:hypothetical protein
MVALVVTALIGGVLLLAGIYPLWPAHLRVPHGVVRPPGMTGTGVPYSYPADESSPSEPGSPLGEPRPEPSAVASPGPGAPSRVPGRTRPGTMTPGAPARPLSDQMVNALGAPIWFEAEDGTLGGDTRMRTVAGASGGQVVTHVGEKAANTVTLNGISVPAAGTYQLTIFYVAGDGPRSANLSVNGGPPQSITFGRTANWSTVGSLTVAITAQAGANSLQFGNPKSKAPDLDRVAVR